MPETVRFAPSPTGELHIGNVRTALFNWFAALSTRGTFVLRYDDTDVARSKAAFAEQIAADMAWLGITPHRVERQSERIAAYDAAADKLREAGLLYPCYETPQELDRKRSRQRARGLPPVYDRAGLGLTQDERAAFEAEGRRPHWRFKLPSGAREFEDRCRGSQTVNLGTVSDPVLVREDGTYLYTLPSVVDDMDFGVTLVVRGEDHITNTGVQIALFEALGGTVPAFAHHNLLIRSDGEPLSKRDNPLSIRALAEAGYERMAVASLASLTGTSHPVAAAPDLETLAATVSLGDVSRAPATFDPAELSRLNASIVHALPVEAVNGLLANVAADKQLFWQTIRGNIALRTEVSPWVARLNARAAGVAHDPAPTTADDRAVIAVAIKLLPPAPWDDGTFKAWTAAVGQETGAKGKRLFMPLRIGLTGLTSGPELSPWLQLLGPEGARKSLEAALAAHEAGGGVA
ncbi:MAG: glutamate--tRNA ligase [Pseudomonadota bacterium]